LVKPNKREKLQMATKPKTTKSTSKPASARKTTTRKSGKSQAPHDKIAEQAYMLWLQRGGSEIDNWLEAERQLR
jgi:hypothetical protein